MQAILFDLFGTLVPNRPPDHWAGCFAEIAAVFGAEPHAFYAEWNKLHQARMVGNSPDGERAFDPILHTLGIRAQSEQYRRAYELRIAFMRQAVEPKPDALETLEALAAAGFKLALVTDCSSGTTELLDGTPLGRYLPVKASSALLRTRKPDPRMYAHALNGLGVPGSQAIYVGDGNSEELPGARRQGMRTVWVDNGPDQHYHERFVPEGDHTVRALKELIPLLAGLRGMHR